MSWSRSALLKAFHGFDRFAAKLPPVCAFQPAKGAFSAYERLSEGILEGKILLERQQPGPCPTGSMTAESGLRQHDHQPWPVFWTRADDARLTGSLRQWRDPAGRVCREGNYHLLQRRRLGEDRLFAPWFPGKATRLEGAWTSLASNWGDGRNYFHWITDNLTRLLVREHLPEPTRILLPRTTAPYIGETLELLGLASDYDNPPATNLLPERYYFCSPVAMTGVWNPLGFDWLRERFRKYFRPPASGPPVFLTRRGGTRVPGDLPVIERVFANAGFEIVDCGTLGIRQQIELTSGAKAVAGIHGAAMTNLLWSTSGMPVLELFLPSYLNACYEQIAFQGNLDYRHQTLGASGALDSISGWCDSLGLRTGTNPGLAET
jgi:hypothetical protein